MTTIPVMPSSVLTIGHSDRTIDDFLGILAQYRVEFLADVRKMPGSRKHPQFNSDALASSPASAGIGYEHFPGLGGLRPRLPDSPNTGWRNASFRAYADYMLTADFQASLDALLARAPPGAVRGYGRRPKKTRRGHGWPGRREPAAGCREKNSRQGPWMALPA